MKRWHGIGFTALCLLSASGWLVDSAFPSDLPVVARQVLHEVVFCLVALFACVVFRSKNEGGGARWFEVAGAGVLLLGVPGALSTTLGVDAGGAALYALVPLFVVVGVAAFGQDGRGRELMVPTLIGAAGALFALPFHIPTNSRSGVAFAMVFAGVLVVAVGCVWMHRALRGWSLPRGVAVLCGANAVLLAAMSVGRGSTGITWHGAMVELGRAFFDLPEIFLLIWLVRELRPEQFAARYFVVPLLTVAEGLILLRPGLTARMGGGLLLMAVGGSVLLFWRSGDESGELPQLGLQ